MAFPILPIGIGLLLLVAASRSRSSGAGSGEIVFDDGTTVVGGGEAPSYDYDPQSGDVADILMGLTQAAGLPADWGVFLQATAAGESGLNPLVGRGDASRFPPWAKANQDANEAAAAARAYNRNEKWLGTCGNKSRYTAGSYGLFALLPANAIASFKGTEAECIDPWSLFEIVPSFVMGVGYARRLMGWDGFKKQPTWANLRVGFRNPSYMGRPEEIERQLYGKNKLGDRLEQLGYDRSFALQPVSPLPQLDLVDLLVRLDGYA